MNREIKFRAWDKEENKMLDADTYRLEVFGNGEVFLKTASRTTSEIVLMQFTGLHDKNGKEIYEGDIGEMQVINEFGSAEVRRGVMELNPDAQYAFKFEADYDFTTSSPPVVIGNIHENPDLLK